MRLSWTPRARADLDRIWLFHAQHDLDVAEQTDRAIRHRTERLVEFPKLGHAIARDIRQWTITELQYVVTYRIDAPLVRILRVHHARENRETP